MILVDTTEWGVGHLQRCSTARKHPWSWRDGFRTMHLARYCGMSSLLLALSELRSRSVTRLRSLREVGGHDTDPDGRRSRRHVGCGHSGATRWPRNIASSAYATASSVFMASSWARRSWRHCSPRVSRSNLRRRSLLVGDLITDRPPRPRREPETRSSTTERTAANASSGRSKARSQPG